jgi:hypothetical protein
MNHPYVESHDGTDKCAKCKFPAIAHGNEATCDCCPNKGVVEIRYGNMLMCNDCWTKEQTASAERMKPENQQARVDAMYSRADVALNSARTDMLNNAMNASRKLDSSVEVRSDLFNAATVAIVDLKKLIDDNPEITNKPYALAEALTERFTHFKKVVFDANEQIVEATNNQKAIQVYLNTLANTLRAEEREKLKLQDINYKPGNIKPIKTVTPVKTRVSKKLDKKELDKYAKELQVSAFTLQMLCVSQGITPEQAANKLRKSIKESLSESTPKVDNEPAVDMGSEAE